MKEIGNDVFFVILNFFSRRKEAPWSSFGFIGWVSRRVMVVEAGLRASRAAEYERKPRIMSVTPSFRARGLWS